MRLIDADKAINNFFDYCKTENVNPLRNEFDGAWIEHFIDLQPTVEAEPIRHSCVKDNGCCLMCDSPIPTDSGRDYIARNDVRYCYFCGAKLDGKENEK